MSGYDIRPMPVVPPLRDVTDNLEPWRAKCCGRTFRNPWLWMGHIQVAHGRRPCERHNLSNCNYSKCRKEQGPDAEDHRG